MPTPHATNTRTDHPMGSPGLVFGSCNDYTPLGRLRRGVPTAEDLEWAVARAEAADRLEARVRELLDDSTARDDVTGTWVDLGRVAALLDPAQPTSPAVDADEGRRG